MQNKLLFSIFLTMALSACAHQSRLPAEKPGTKYGLHAQPLSLENSGLATSQSFWKIIPYYRGQKTESSCSLASVTMVINAILPSHNSSSEAKIYTEKSILQISGSTAWARATAEDGNGLSLKALEVEVRELFKKLKLHDKFETKAISAEDLTLKSFRKYLSETLSGKTWIITNFDQGFLMGQGSYGHFSPLASYNPVKDQVLVLDSDAEWYEPYWVSSKHLMDSMNTTDSDSGSKRGFLIIRKKL